MERGVVRSVLWIQAIVLGAVGLALYGWPTEAAAYWPWLLPPLAARFVGSAFLGIAAAAATIAAWRGEAGLRVLAAMAIGTLLAPLTGLVTTGVDVSIPRLAAMAAGLGALALADIALVRMTRPADLPAWVARTRPEDPPGGEAWGPLSRASLAFFAVHLALVLPVGLVMYVVPSVGVAEWPWKLSEVNVRLVGGIFLASAALSAMALRDRDWAAAYPTAAAYAVFAALALAAMAVHFGLFDAGRLRTWLFVGLYAFVAIGAIGGLSAASRFRPTDRPLRAPQAHRT